MSAIKIFRYVATVSAVLLVVACATEVPAPPGNPPAPGFNLAGSDAAAIDLADAVMESMGGRDAWDNTRYITWKFFGRRRHVWDKQTGDIRYDDGDLCVLMNINTQQGRVTQAGAAVTDPDSVKKYLNRAYRSWINDSYWLVMPYKLKDSGVTLTYKGEGALLDGRPADILTLTFENVGVTPQNKYDVYVSRDRKLVEQWAFYRNAGDPEPSFNIPWADWQPYGGILLANDNGRNNNHTDKAVFDELPEHVFQSPEPVDMMALVK